MTWLLLASLGQDAHASACCVASTSALPSRLGRCETTAVGVRVGGAGGNLRYDGDAQVQASSLKQLELSTEVFGGWRWSRWGQLGVRVPAALQYRATDALDERGGGVGDVRLGVLLETPEERAGPTPVVALGLRLPTGTSWDQSSGDLGADITGRGGFGASGSIGLERTSSAWPWTVTVSTEMDRNESWLMSPQVAATLGHTLGPQWTASASLAHLRSFGLPRSSDAASTRIGAQIVHGRSGQYRTWLAVGSDVPLAFVGQDRAIEHSGSVGYTRLF
ncbi:MAG: hypothetical protein GY913_05750 [Proteobacteria bacterium]|nr:hypothetical protein [Pseudomonadota bacterium]MCP4916408.1 hypothetical protein [Pseudomonadota bacterium]